jgi:hypothetical protein
MTPESAKSSASSLLARLRKAGKQEPQETQYDESPLTRLTEVSAVWNIRDSQVGSGTIEAHATADQADPLINLTLRWRGDHEQPEVWEIIWWHGPGYILDNLPQYLLAYCPVPNEMIEVLKSLGLENFPQEE